jgi:hypothetical protein
MVRGRFLHIGFTWAKAEPKITELKPIFDNALDWARYAPNSWVLWTTTEPGDWLARINPHLGEGDHVFICELNAASTPENFTGIQPKWFWTWLQKDRSK